VGEGKMDVCPLDEEEDVNVDGENEEGVVMPDGARERFHIQVSNMTNKPSKLLEKQEPEEAEFDFSLLDQLIGFL
jgi:hypothetical protein